MSIFECTDHSLLLANCSLSNVPASHHRTAVLVGILLSLTACQPADLDAHLSDYERLVVLARQEGRSSFLWFATNAPDEARRLMARLHVRAVYFNQDEGVVYLRRGGGYLPEYGYIYRLPAYDSTSTDRWDAGAEHVRERWYFFQP